MTKSPLEFKRPLFIANLKHVYLAASDNARLDGTDWYPKARRIVTEWSGTYGTTVEQTACIVSAISPQCDWERNLIIADDVLAGRVASIGGAILSNVSKSRIIRNTQSMGAQTDYHALMLKLFPMGPKVNSFAYNLAGNDRMVTIDVHAIQAAFNDVLVNVHPKWTPYRIIAECYAQVARFYGMQPATLQAIIWCAWKEKHPAVHKRAQRRNW